MMEKRALEWSRSQRPEEFQQLEECLLWPEVRWSSHELVDLLADNFVEFGSSDQIFDKTQIIQAL
jgi:hypothetical protein